MSSSMPTGSKVVPLKLPISGKRDDPRTLINPMDDTLWFCKCDCSIFYLLADGGIQCAGCGSLQTRAHFDPRC